MTPHSRFHKAIRAAACTSIAALALGASGAQADTLRDALVAAYNTNPTLEGARANQRAEDENVPIQRAPGLPTVNGDASLTEILRANSTSFFQPARVFSAAASDPEPGSVRQ